MRGIAIGLLRLYQKLISPWLPQACRFQPTCSSYAIDAVELYGVRRGGWMALRRLLRCHPFSAGGFDPVPPPSALDRRSGHCSG
jgi:putative membrane protein insertion efficiency factor